MDAQEDLKSIIGLDSELNQIQDLDLLMERILLEARKVAHADAGSIYIKETVEENGLAVDKLAIRYSQNDTLQRQLAPGKKLGFSVFSIPINDKTISGYCAFAGKLVNVPDVYHISPGAPYSYSTSFDEISRYKTASVLSVPLITSEGRLLGVIQVINALDGGGNAVPFSADDELYITHFASSATLVLQRAYITRAMILRMIRMAELRDPRETGTHVNRVAGYAVEIYDRWAYRHGVSQGEREKFRDSLKIAAMLHDVGKVAISDTILKKPARFTEEEYRIMQGHTLQGAELFDDSQSSLDLLARDIALNHHENWDGTGYPGWVDPVTRRPLKMGEDDKVPGKKGEEIPLSARIIALADVFDALCSKRVYKEPWEEADVLTAIREMSGTKFEPELVEIFFEILPGIKQIQSFYPEPPEP